MPLTHKERLQRAVCRQPIDRLPTQINYTASMGQKLAAHFNLPADELSTLLLCHGLNI
jgi:uroporphyrinogen decarboxylase